MPRPLLILIILIYAVSFSPALAQEETPEADTIIYGGRVTGQIGNARPRGVYYFDALRGDVISIRLAASVGDLDPVLTLLDSAGTVLANLDDTDGGRDVFIEAFRIPQSGRYYLIVGRFGYGLGITSGGYDLTIERIGVSSASGSALRYGDTVINTITNMTPQVYYSFRAERGDIVNITMQQDSGNLDPYLQIVNSSAFVVADNDDMLGSGLDAGIIGLVIEEAGTYIIIASRYGEAAGNTTGRFILSLQEAQNSGFGNSPETSVPLLVGAVDEAELTARQFTRYYSFDARANDIVNVRMSRTSGNLDSFLVLANAGLNEIASDDDSGGGQNAQIEDFLIPADGRYYILATRFDREAGTTAGGYRLEFQSLGSAFENVVEGAQRISYGSTVTGRVDNTTPEALFAFWGVEGDTISVSLNRGDGDLDPVLGILDNELRQLVSDDDSGGGQNARIPRYTLRRTGVHYIRVTRFSGADGNTNTQGSFILVLARVFQ